MLVEYLQDQQELEEALQAHTVKEEELQIVRVMHEAAYLLDQQVQEDKVLDHKVKEVEVILVVQDHLALVVKEVMGEWEATVVADQALGAEAKVAEAVLAEVLALEDILEDNKENLNKELRGETNG